MYYVFKGHRCIYTPCYLLTVTIFCKELVHLLLLIMAHVLLRLRNATMVLGAL